MIGITSCHYHLLTAIMLSGISRVHAHMRFVMSSRGNDASYMHVLEIAYFKSIIRMILFVISDEPLGSFPS